MSSGLLGSVQSLGASLLALARTRLELFSTELQEELTRLIFGVVGTVAVLLLAALGAAFAALALLIALPAEHRVLAAAGIAAAFFGAAALAAWSMRRATREKPRLLAASLAELERDYEAVRP